MPTYEFRCPEGHEFEKFYRTISGAEARAACPQCGRPAERFMSATGFAFKGSGFYLTDYGKNAHRDKGTPEPKSGAPAGEGSVADGGKAELKSEAPAAGAANASAAEPKQRETKSTDTKSADSKPADSKQADSKPATSKPSTAPAKKSSSE